MADFNQRDEESIIIVGDRVDLVISSGVVYRALIEDRLDDGPFLLAIPSRKGILMPVEQNDDIYLVFYRESGRYIAQMKVLALETRGLIRYMWLLQKTIAQKNQRREAYRLPVSFNVQIFEYDEELEKRGDLSEILTASGNPAQKNAAQKRMTQSSASQRSSIQRNAAQKSAMQKDSSEQVRAVALERVDSKDLSITGIALITRKQYTLEDMYILAMQPRSSFTGARAIKPENHEPPLVLTAAVKRSVPWRTSGKYNTGMHFIGMSKETSDEIAKFVLTEQQKQMRMRRLG